MTQTTRMDNVPFLNKSHFEDLIDTISKYSSPVASFEKIKKLFSPRGQYNLYRFVHLAAFICSRCKNQKKSSLIIYVKNKSEKPLCNDCYDRFVSTISVKKIDGKSKYSNVESVTITSFSSKIYIFTHTFETEDWKKNTYDIDFDVVDAVFCADETFVIRHKNNDRAVAVNDDENV